MKNRALPFAFLLVLLVVFVVGSLALTARLAYWQVVDRERLASEAMAQTTVNLETPSKRGDVFDRTGTIVLATTVPRERLVGKTTHEVWPKDAADVIVARDRDLLRSDGHLGVEEEHALDSPGKGLRVVTSSERSFSTARGSRNICSR